MIQQAHRKNFKIWKSANDKSSYPYPFVLTSPALGVFIHFLPNSRVYVNLEGFKSTDEKEAFQDYYSKTDRVVPLDDTTLIWFIHNYIEFKRQLTSFTYDTDKDKITFTTLPLNDSLTDEKDYHEVNSYLQGELGLKIKDMILEMCSSISEHIHEFQRRTVSV